MVNTDAALTADDSGVKATRKLPRLSDLLALSCPGTSSISPLGNNSVPSLKLFLPLGWGTPVPNAVELGLPLRAPGGLDLG